MTQHINPGTDTTINPVVIDDSYRSKKIMTRNFDDGEGPQLNVQRQDPAEILFICSLEDLNCLHDYIVAAMAGDDISELPRLWNQQIGVIRSHPYTSASAHPTEAQQRIDAAIKELEKARVVVVSPVTNWEYVDDKLVKAIALLQAGDHHE